MTGSRPPRFATLARDYAALGYDMVRVPVLERQERLGFVLERYSS